MDCIKILDSVSSIQNSCDEMIDIYRVHVKCLEDKLFKVQGELIALSRQMDCVGKDCDVEGIVEVDDNAKFVPHMIELYGDLIKDVKASKEKLDIFESRLAAWKSM